MWDPAIVLDFMVRSGSNDSLDFTSLSKKLVTIIALATLLRVSEIASISKDSVHFSSDGVSFSLSRLRKTQKSGAYRSFSIRRMENPILCPVDCLGHYVYTSDNLRSNSNQKYLLLGLRPPHKSVSGTTVGRWVKDYLSLAGIDSRIFSAHSTRGAASSKAAKMGVPIDSILKTANWSRQSTFSRFYHRDLQNHDVVDAVFQTSV